MTKRKIRYGNDPVLRSRCEEVKVVDNKIRSLLGEMLETLHKTDNSCKSGRHLEKTGCD